MYCNKVNLLYGIDHNKITNIKKKKKLKKKMAALNSEINSYILFGFLLINRIKVRKEKAKILPNTKVIILSWAYIFESMRMETSFM